MVPADDPREEHERAFHRNMEVSARYVWMYQLRSDSLKWAAMAAFA